MILTFQIGLLIILVVSLLGVIGEKKDKKLREILTGMFFASLAASVAIALWI